MDAWRPVGFKSAGHGWSGSDGCEARTASRGGSRLAMFVPPVAHSHELAAGGDLMCGMTPAQGKQKAPGDAGAFLCTAPLFSVACSPEWAHNPRASSWESFTRACASTDIAADTTRSISRDVETDGAAGQRNKTTAGSSLGWDSSMVSLSPLEVSRPEASWILGIGIHS